MEATRKPEYHLHLIVPDNGCMHWPLTYDEVANLIEERVDVHTFQVCTISTHLFDLGYRIFVHYSEIEPPFEITLGDCEKIDREIRMAHNLEKMLISGAFDIPDDLFPNY